MTQPLDIAVIGSGIAGLSAAWLLASRHKVTLLERADRFGGHSNTVVVAAPEGDIPIDTGFIVYNTASYPNLIALFDHLRVATAPTAMSFAASLDGGAHEYKGSLVGLFGQASNLAKPRHWRMIGDTLRFFRDAARDLGDDALDAMSLGAYLRHRGYGDGFVHDHILPMGAAIWSTPDADILAFPALSFIKFFANHGLLRVRGRPQWRTVQGGSRQYLGKMLARLGGRVKRNSGVDTIERHETGVEVVTVGGKRHRFDHVVIAAHADEALAMLGDADADETRLLGSFGYTRNAAVLHTDASAMPRRRRLWASWNYMAGAPGDPFSVSYWMNSLQPLATRRDYFVTLNPRAPIAPRHLLARFDYQHPMFDAKAVAAQRHLWSLQGRRRTWFAGSYFGHGFHEDALQAGLAVAEDLGGVKRPWTVADDSGRIHRMVVGASSITPGSVRTAERAA